MERELATLVEAIRSAGTKVRELVKVGFEVQTKQDRSPVTTVDHEVNRILHEMQRLEFPQDAWLSEESPDDPARLTNRRVWIVDPIDGTKALVNRMPEFCISAALIERGATGRRRDPQSLDRRTLHCGARRRTVLERHPRHPLLRS